LTDQTTPRSLGERVSRGLPTVLLVGALFVPRVAEGLYAGLGRELPDAFGALATLLLFVSVAVWFWFYCRTHHLPWIMDMGWFLMLAWPIVVPYYVISREGRRGLLRIGLFLLTYLAAWATGWATAIWARLLIGKE
jgi:hypothetical protein